ncbi:MAG: hypothetical protein R2860_17670 [Desulfobacterales bacterium]
MNSIEAISVFDGRYHRYTQALNDIFSEYGLIRHRVFAEIQWLTFKELALESVSEAEIRRISAIAADFDVSAAERV